MNNYIIYKTVLNNHSPMLLIQYNYRRTSNINRILVGSKIVDH